MWQGEKKHFSGQFKALLYFFQLLLTPLITITTGTFLTVLLVIGILAIVLPVPFVVIWLAIDIPSWCLKAMNVPTPQDEEADQKMTFSRMASGLGLRSSKLQEKEEFVWTNAVVKASISQALGE